jgi:hypothetical protein
MSRANSGTVRLESVSTIGALTAADEYETRAAPKSAELHSSLDRRLFSGADVPGSSVTSGVLGSASRTVCDDALPDAVINWLALWWAEWISTGRLLGWLF